MRYERRNQLTAILSGVSVVTALVASLMSLKVDGVSGRSVQWLAAAAGMAGCAAVLRIMLSRRLTRQRERQRVFLIYAREDLERVRDLAERLREQGFHPWLDVDEITPGQVWQRAVIRALEESAVALVLVSHHLQKNGFVQDELKTAVETLQERDPDVSPVIPVRLDDAPVPERLAHVHWVDWSAPDGPARLFAGLKTVLAEHV
jgi:hypothetical protein